MSDEPPTPERLLDTARLIAGQMLALPVAYHEQELARLKEADPVYHALVKACMEELRRETPDADPGEAG